MSWSGEFVLDNDPDAIPPIVSFLQEASQILGLPRRETEGLGVALQEALLNGIEHGNLEVSSRLRQGDGAAFDDLVEKRRRETPYRDRRVRLRADVNREQAVFLIRDEGHGFAVADLPDPREPSRLERIGGRGVLLMREYMDQVQYNRAGNEVRLVKRRSRS